MTKRVQGVILDIDGILVDSNDAHAHTWVQTLNEHGYQVSLPDERSRLLQVIDPGVSRLFAEETLSKDASHSKPDPDVIHAALQRGQLHAANVSQV